MKTLNELTYLIRGAAFKVHSALGPGLLESAYEACLVHELKKLGLTVQQQVPLPLIYQDVRLSVGYRVDLLVEGAVILELKSVRELTDVDTAQVLTYMRLSKTKVGLLMNFNVKNMQHGIKRYIL